MITSADQNLILQELTGIVEAETGFLTIPSPMKFVDKRDFISAHPDIVEADRDTQDKIDEIDVEACWVHFRGWTDVGGPEDSPLKSYNYDLTFFVQADRERVNEGDAFQKRVLKNYNRIVEAVVNLQAEVYGSRNLGVLDEARYAVQQTSALIVQQELTSSTTCEFVPGVIGYLIVLREGVQIQLVEC